MKSTHSPQYMEVIANLRAARLRAGLSQEELARRLGKLQSYVAKVETCERRLDLVETLAFCEALDISLSTLIPRAYQHLLSSSDTAGEDNA